VAGHLILRSFGLQADVFLFSSLFSSLLSYPMKCNRCNLPTSAPHLTPYACIEALKDALAVKDLAIYQQTLELNRQAEEIYDLRERVTMLTPIESRT
jgi:hypothetical protein